MKERKQTREDVINEFLKDEEVKNLIRSLAHIADERGLNVSNLNAAIKIVWKEEISEHSDEKDEKKALTEEEQQYMKKVDNFIRYYKNELLSAYKEAADLGHGVSKDFVSDEKNFFEIIKEGLVTLYIVFYNEDYMPKQTVEKYLKNYFGNYYYADYLKRPLIDFLCCLNFNEDNPKEKPTYGKYYMFGFFNSQDGFKEFSKRFSYTRNNLSEAAIKTIWLINTYF